LGTQHFDVEDGGVPHKVAEEQEGNPVQATQKRHCIAASEGTGNQCSLKGMLLSSFPYPVIDPSVKPIRWSSVFGFAQGFGNHALLQYGIITIQ
jgi:hypothetical protein